MKERILELLRSHPNCLPTVIADSLAANGSSIRKALTILRRQKKVTRRANGQYILWEQPAPAETSAITT